MSELIRITHGLWRPSDAVAELSGLCAAILEAMPLGAAIAGRAGGAIRRLWLPAFDGRIDVALTRPGELPRSLPHSERAEVRFRRRSIAADELGIVEGVLVTTEERTWIDLAEELSLPDLVACGDSILRSDEPHLPLELMIRRANGRRGVRRAREALELLNSRSRSRPESHMRVALILGGLPAPEVNKAIYDSNGGWLAEPDLHYEVPKLALEYQGEGHAEVTRMRRDITRNIDVVGDDWLSVPFGPSEVFGRPWSLAPFVGALIERRAPGWLREWRETRRVAGNIPPLGR